MMRDLDKIFWDGSTNEPLGAIWAAGCNKGLVALRIGGDEDGFEHMLAARYGGKLTRSKDQVAPVMRQIKAYLKGERKSFEIPIHWAVLSPFQEKVLRSVYAIPYGETRSYGQIGNQIGMPQAARAVGRANATNPIPLVIPCHRVIGADGGLRGYGSGEGIQTKAWLLDLEKEKR